MIVLTTQLGFPEQEIRHMNVPETLEVQNLIAEIERKNGHPTGSVFLMSGSQLLAGHLQLSDCGIVDGSVITVLIREPITPDQKARMQMWIQQMKTPPPPTPILKMQGVFKKNSCKTKQPKTQMFIPIPKGMGKHIVSTLAIRSTLEETAALSLLDLRNKCGIN